MSTRKKKDVRAAAQVREASEDENAKEEQKAPETAGEAPVVASTRASLWVIVLLLVPLTLCIVWGALTR